MVDSHEVLRAFLYQVFLKTTQTQSNFNRAFCAYLENNAFKQVSSLAKAYAETLECSITQIEQITLSLKYYWEEMGSTVKLKYQVRKRLYSLSSLLYLNIADRDGTSVTSTLDKTKSPSLARRDYFQIHKMP
jgi:hypothetical protein